MSLRQNIWISTEKTLIIGYDVAHPGTRDELMNKMPLQKPSVVGFSSSVAVFIGDYHYQTPRGEQVIEDEFKAIKQACGIRKTSREKLMGSEIHSVKASVPGTVMGMDVVQNDLTEFYMQSHHPVQKEFGTSSESREPLREHEKRAEAALPAVPSPNK
ncbi:hypothetical protein OSTOST_00092 [Ostertagia ostertagi]